MLLAVPDFLAFERPGVAEGVAEHLGQKIALHLRFVEFREAARTLQIGPFHQDRVRGLQVVLVKPLVYGGILQETRRIRRSVLG